MMKSWDGGRSAISSARVQRGRHRCAHWSGRQLVDHDADAARGKAPVGGGEPANDPDFDTDDDGDGGGDTVSSGGAAG